MGEGAREVNKVVCFVLFDGLHHMYSYGPAWRLFAIEWVYLDCLPASGLYEINGSQDLSRTELENT